MPAGGVVTLSKHNSVRPQAKFVEQSSKKKRLSKSGSHISGHGNTPLTLSLSGFEWIFPLPLLSSLSRHSAPPPHVLELAAICKWFTCELGGAEVCKFKCEIRGGLPSRGKLKPRRRMKVNLWQMKTLAEQWCVDTVWPLILTLLQWTTTRGPGVFSCSLPLVKIHEKNHVVHWAPELGEPHTL